MMLASIDGVTRSAAELMERRQVWHLIFRSRAARPRWYLVERATKLRVGSARERAIEIHAVTKVNGNSTDGCPAHRRPTKASDS